MYEGWLYRLGSAGGVSSVDPCARENPPLPPLVIHIINTILTYMAVTPSGEGGCNGKKPIWVWGRCEGRGERDEGWDEISRFDRFQFGKVFTVGYLYVKSSVPDPHLCFWTSRIHIRIH